MQANYVPRGSKLRWKSFLLLFIACCILAYGGRWLMTRQQKQQVTTYGVCGMTNIETRAMFENQTDDPEQLVTLQDYLFYGETLNLYHEAYDRQQQDLFIGKTVILRNLCTGLDFVYMMEKNADGQIPLEDLDEGFYQVFILQDLKEKQVYTEEKIRDSFYTVTRDNTNRKIELIADSSLFNELQEQDFLKKNYLFIQVSTEKQPEEWIDIMIDPGGMNRDNGYVDRGVHGNDLLASEENYRMAVLLKEKLEAYGLKVEITRDSDEVVNSYGVDGRLERAYRKNARYYINIEMKSAVNPNLRGTDIVYSSFCSNRMAATVLKSIVEQTSLIPAREITGTASSTVTSEDGLEYDGHKMIRESGGKILGAGMYSESSRENASFAAENRRGMQALTIQYAFLAVRRILRYGKKSCRRLPRQQPRGSPKHCVYKRKMIRSWCRIIS